MHTHAHVRAIVTASIFAFSSSIVYAAECQPSKWGVGDQIGNSNLVLLYGDYGTGKSHALLWARHQILDAKKSEFNSVCYYIQTLRKDGKISGFALW